MNPSTRGAGPLVGRFQLLAMLPAVSLSLTVAAAAGVVVAALLPLCFTFARGVLIGAVPGSAAGGLDSPPGRQALLGLAAVAVLSMVVRVVGPLRAVLATALAEKLQLHLEERVMRAVARPAGIAHLEDPAVLDRIALAQEVGTVGYRPAGALIALSNMSPLWLQSVLYAVVLAQFRWWLALLVYAAWYFASYVKHRETFRTARVAVEQTRLQRRANYVRDLGLTAEPAKEVRLFALTPWLLQQFETEWLRAMADVWRERKKSTPPIVASTLLLTAALVGAFVVLGLAALRGEIGLGALAVFTGAAFGMGSFMGMGTDDTQLEHGTAAVPAALEIEALTAVSAIPTGAAAADGLPHKEIRFENVTFSYPGSDRPTLDRLNLVIPADRSLAIVGANGAGKTTLIKLLCRLYAPTAGRITVDGVDLRDLDPTAWQRQIAAIFQDFARYRLPLRDNVGFGAVEAASGPDAQDRLVRAVRRAGALDVVESLPNGWDTVLSREFAGGADLSGGQWQRVALARALFAAEAGARVLVLDEPTASLDVRAEAALYDRFLEITAGLITILISHRFSTVRHADRIVVLEGGTVVEQGTHGELVSAGGRYATMFSLQAARFVGDAADPTGEVRAGETRTAEARHG